MQNFYIIQIMVALLCRINHFKLVIMNNVKKLPLKVFRLKPLGFYVFNSIVSIAIVIPIMFFLTAITLSPLYLHIPMYLCCSSLFVLAIIYYIKTVIRNPGINHPYKYYEQLLEKTLKCFSKEQYDVLLQTNETLRILNMRANSTIDFNILKNSKPYTFKFCEVCLTHKALRCSHTKQTNLCVVQFDHFCKWIGQVVGVNNRPSFIQGIRMCFYYAICIFIYSVTGFGINCYQLYICRESIINFESFGLIIQFCANRLRSQKSQNDLITLPYIIASLIGNGACISLSAYFIKFITGQLDYQNQLLYTNTLTKEYLNDNFLYFESLVYSNFGWSKNYQQMVESKHLYNNFNLKNNKLFQQLLDQITAQLKQNPNIQQIEDLLIKLQEKIVTHDKYSKQMFLYCQLLVNIEDQNKIFEELEQQLIKQKLESNLNQDDEDEIECLHTTQYLQNYNFQEFDENSKLQQNFKLYSKNYKKIIRYEMLLKLIYQDMLSYLYNNYDEMIKTNIIFFNCVVENFFNLSQSVVNIHHTENEVNQFRNEFPELFDGTAVNLYLSKKQQRTLKKKTDLYFSNIKNNQQESEEIHKMAIQ